MGNENKSKCSENYFYDFPIPLQPFKFQMNLFVQESKRDLPAWASVLYMSLSSALCVSLSYCFPLNVLYNLIILQNIIYINAIGEETW